MHQLPFGKKYILPLIKTPEDIIPLKNLKLNAVDKQLLVKGICNLYLKQVLTLMKDNTAKRYEEENNKLKLIADSPKEKHSANHMLVLKNTEKLMHNLKIINDAIAETEAAEDNISTHVAVALNLEKTSIVKLHLK